MPTKKQKRRELKSKRHQYEFVYVDSEGNELDEPPPELVEREQERKERSVAKTTTAKQQPAKRGGRREPLPPSWSRAAKRSLLLGVFFVILLALTAKGHRVAVAAEGIVLALVYMPMMYAMDRWMYRRHQAKLANGGASAARDRATPRPAKKR